MISGCLREEKNPSGGQRQRIALARIFLRKGLEF